MTVTSTGVLHIKGKRRVYVCTKCGVNFDLREGGQSGPKANSSMGRCREHMRAKPAVNPGG